MHYNLDARACVGEREGGIFFRSEMQSTERRVGGLLNVLFIVAILAIRKEHYEGCSISRNNHS